ncbi:MAG: hypothetical protein ACKVP0_02500 [Pirellulaceae bacterium]
MTSFRFSIREIFLVTLVAALVFGWGTQSYIRSWPSSHEKALMQGRLEALQEIVRNDRGSLGESSRFDFKAFRDAEVNALAAEIELEESHSQRLKLHEQIVEATQRYETMAAKHYEVGSGTHRELQDAKAERLKAEIALEREKAGR